MSARKSKPRTKPAKRSSPKKKGPVDVVAAVRKELLKALGGEIKPQDMPAFESGCEAIVILERSQAEVKKCPVITLPNKVKAVNPHAKIVDMERKIVADFYTRFGLSPLDRSRTTKAGVGLPKGTVDREEDDFEALLRSRPATIPMPKREAV